MPPLGFLGLILGSFTLVRCDIVGIAVEKGEDCLRRVNESVGVKPECIGAPDQQTTLCPLKDSSARTVHVAIPEVIDFNNTSGDEVSLYWISDAGAEILQKTILPWKSTTQDTFMGHVFRIKSSTGQTLLEHTVGLIPLHDHALGAEAAKKITTDPAPQTDKKVEVGFVNRADAPMKLFYKTPLGQLQLVAQMEPHTVYPQHTFKGHQFEVHSFDDRFVTSAQIRPIVVPSCIDSARSEPVVAGAAACADCAEKPARASRLKIRDYQATPQEPRLKIRRLSKREEL
jgi:hypothetical protein